MCGEAVSRYTRSDGTQVVSYTRAAPSTSRCNSYSQNDTVQGKGYTRSDGTRVSSYTRAAPRTSDNLASSGTVKVSGYTRADGTKVSGYTRAVPQQKCSTSNKAVGVYVDNSCNRKIGRVGMPVGSFVIHTDGDHYTRS